MLATSKPGLETIVDSAESTNPVVKAKDVVGFPLLTDPLGVSSKDQDLNPMSVKVSIWKLMTNLSLKITLTLCTNCS